MLPAKLFSSAFVFQLSLFSVKLVFVSPGTYLFGVLMLGLLEKRKLFTFSDEEW